MKNNWHVYKNWHLQSMFNLWPFYIVSLLIIEFWEFFIHSAFKSFIRYMDICKYFFLVCTCLLIPVTMKFKEQKFSNFMKYNISICSFMNHDFGFISKNSLPNPRWQWFVYSMISFRNFMILGLYLTLWFVLHTDLQFPSTICWKY